MTKLPKVTVVTPSFNQGEFIEETLLSVKNQDYPYVEHVVMDGGSSDNTVEILEKYSDSIIWASEPDKGHADAVNKAILKSKGEIIGWLNSDDTYTDGAIKKAIDYMFSHPEVDMLYGNCNFVNKEGNLLEKKRTLPFDYNILLYTNFLMPQQTFFMKRKVFDEIGLLDINLDCTLDWDISLRIAERFKVAYLDEFLANFRWHQDCKSMSKDQDRAVKEIRLTRSKFHSRKTKNKFLKSNVLYIELLKIIYKVKKVVLKFMRNFGS